MRWIGALFFVAALAIWPGVALEAARGAMEAWATSVAPALFPFGGGNSRAHLPGGAHGL